MTTKSRSLYPRREMSACQHGLCVEIPRHEDDNPEISVELNHREDDMSCVL